MLDARESPHAHVVEGADDVRHSGHRFLETLAVAPDRAHRLALLGAVGPEDGVKLNDDLDHVSSPNLVIVGVLWSSRSEGHRPKLLSRMPLSSAAFCLQT